MDDLTDEVDLAFGAVRLGWRGAGPYTLLLGLVALLWSGANYFANDTWFLGVVGQTLLGLMLGWIIDVLVALTLRPLLRITGKKTRGWKSGLALGAPLCAIAIGLLSYYNWI